MLCIHTCLLITDSEDTTDEGKCDTTNMKTKSHERENGKPRKKFQY